MTKRIQGGVKAKINKLNQNERKEKKQATSSAMAKSASQKTVSSFIMAIYISNVSLISIVIVKMGISVGQQIRESHGRSNREAGKNE